ncbi:hypothetical protein ACFE04_006918 [Oxalis oulophora]
MAQLAGEDEIESFRIELADISRRIGSSFRSHLSSFRSISVNSAEHNDSDDEHYELQWEVIQRLPTFERITTALFDDGKDAKGKQPVNVAKLGAQERHLLIEKLIKDVENDNLLLQQKLRKRIDKVGVLLPTVEVRFKNLCVEAECEVVRGKPLPTLLNTAKSILSEFASLSCSKQETKINILKDVNGIIKPGRMTLLLGPPGCGKTTLLLALSGNLSHSLKILGLDICADTRVGDVMRRGISGGQKKRLTTVDQFINKFNESDIGQKICKEILKPFDISEIKKNALSFEKYSLSRRELFKACAIREFRLMKRNSFVYVFKSTQLVIIASVTMTAFLRTRMKVDNVHANYYLGSLFYALVILLVDGFPELQMTVSRLAVFYGQRDMCFYPAWAYAIPAIILKIPLSLLESFVWTSLTYYVIGYSPEFGRFLRQFLLYFIVHLTSISMFRSIASLCRTVVASTTFGSVSILFVLLFSGFIIPHSSMPAWLSWGFWLSPLTYGEIGLTVNEFLSPRWENIMSGNTSVGRLTLENRGLSFDSYFYWISVGALIGFTFLFNVIFTLALTFSNTPGKSRAMISYEKFSLLTGKNPTRVTPNTTTEPRKGSTIINFEPLTVAFKDVQYSVDTPQNGWEQLKACLWKQHLSYWRSPSYNLMRIVFIFVSSLLFGTLFWQKGNKIKNQQDLFNIFGSMYVATIFFGINNCSTVLPYVSTERLVLYRERFAGMYSSRAYSFAQVQKFRHISFIFFFSS